jgi:hypothetical protein
MGCIAGPVIANIYIYILERKWLSMNPDILYYRFIDDIFMAAMRIINLEEFRNSFLYLKLNIENSKTVVFLDLEININNITGKFGFSLYIKPTNTFGYLLPNSNHPKHIFSNIPCSLIKRIRRICSTHCDFLYHSNNLLFQLLKRGYNYNLVNELIRKISRIDREELLPYNSKNKTNFEASKVFLNYNSSYSFLNNYFCLAFGKLSNEFSNINMKKLLIVNNINNNIEDLVINNFNINKIAKYFYKKCNNLYCICKFSLDNFYFLKNDKLFLPCKSSCNCESTGCIYIIICKKCNMYYIGESSRSLDLSPTPYLFCFFSARNTRNFLFN